jgi:putative glycosyltransferase (TIGR04372 family)
MPHNWAYGHLALEMLMSLAMARVDEASVYFIERTRVVNRALFLLKSDAVKVLSRSRWIAWLIRTLWAIRQLMRRLSLPWEGIFSPASDRTFAESKNDKIDDDGGPYFRRLLIRTPVPVHLSAGDRREAIRQAEAVGILENTKLVTLHVREAGFRSRPGRPEHRSMSTRNARIETYHKAIDFLIEQGYFMVRIGDSTMTPLDHRGVLDLAKSTKRTELLELYCLMKSHFLLGCESGLLGVSYLINTPLLNVNATDPVSSYPVRRDGLYILKRVVDHKTESVLSLADMVKEDYLFNLRNVDRYTYMDNTSDEILDATKEMVVSLKAGWKPNAAQREYKKIISAAVDDLKDRWEYVKKWGPEEGFLGDGWIGSAFAERNLYPG